MRGKNGRREKGIVREWEMIEAIAAARETGGDKKLEGAFRRADKF